ncbi:GTP cyclohydrolase II [Saccharopolyspora sp. NFXS83]|uniref:GTP cyclohydrolase II n=1 Tax=Saccharopolyspora sp. NFXS83 TaxID=2993560 RepID=UPI00224B7793|nr:GTP cyclohydrolase II [Saccharopolyspora sp. NFXS83]MCX2729215.1 GTP cyclohydrolase II [Saccharopolyspora sp. NFXS83]
MLERAGHTEAGVDLCRAAGLSGAALLCEIVTPDRRAMMRRPELDDFALRHDVPMITIADLVEHARTAEAAARPTGRADLPTDLGTFQAATYPSAAGIEHLALTMGDPRGAGAPLVRLHSECLTGDLVGSLRCDCGAAMSAIAEQGRGILVYLRGHEGRGIGLGHKLRAYALQQHRGMDTVEANVELGFPVDGRDYTDAARILHELGVSSVRLMTNNPDKCRALAERGIAVAERIALEVPSNPHSTRYLAAERDRMGHLLQRPA